MGSWTKQTTATVDGLNNVTFNTSTLNTSYAFTKTASGQHITIKFDGNGGNGYISPARSLEGTLITLPTNIYVRVGYNFIGWLVDGESIVRSARSAYTVPSKDVTIRAQWSAEPVTTYTVTYKAGEGTGDDWAVQNIVSGTTHFLYSLNATHIKAPDGKVLDKWAEGTISGPQYSAGTGIQVTEDKTFIALYKDAPAPTFTGLCFTANTAGSTITAKSNQGKYATLKYSTDKSTWLDFGTTTSTPHTETIEQEMYMRMFNVSATPEGGTTVDFYINNKKYTTTLDDYGNFSFGDNDDYQGSYYYDTIMFNMYPSEEEIFNKVEWSTSERMYPTITLSNIGDVVYIKGTFDDTSITISNYLNFIMSGSISASGNIMSLGCGDNFESILTIPYYMMYYSLFKGCTSLTTPPELPATTLTNNCYAGMFQGCTSLTIAPSLPATTLSASCYSGMFQSCTSLIAAPSLPATTLAERCYENMFRVCTSLTTAPTLVATTLTNYCYLGMFHSCTALATAPNLPATTLSDTCYATMFQGCTSLTTAPSLPATTLAYDCYSQMFYNCTSLTTVPKLPATNLQYNCYFRMFSGCTSLYVSAASGTSYNKSWRIPTSGNLTNSTTQKQGEMFTNCLGTRSSNDLAGVKGRNYIYYTQNTPV